MHSYSQLKVWQRSMTLCQEVYLLTRSLPSDERFGLSSQMRRAAVSIPSNIAEGTASRSAKGLERFLRFALGSEYELDTQLLLTTRVGFLDPDAVEPVRTELVEIRAMIVGLARSADDQTT
jgi:four helix bundle protein